MEPQNNRPRIPLEFPEEDDSYILDIRFVPDGPPVVDLYVDGKYESTLSYEEAKSWLSDLGYSYIVEIMSEGKFIQKRDDFKTRKYESHGNQEKHEEADICVVCQSEYEEEEALGCLRCGHEYHFDCIRIWLLKRNVCPMCRRTALN